MRSKQTLHNVKDYHTTSDEVGKIAKISKCKKLVLTHFVPTQFNEKKLINGCANITGGGLLDNLIRVIPEKLSININLSKIKTKPIFSWLKKNNISDLEMLKTFNCGVGFCLIANKKNINKIKKVFSKKFEPYEIGYITKGNKKVSTFGKLRW